MSLVISVFFSFHLFINKNHCINKCYITFHDSIFRKLIIPIQSKVERRERRREEKALIAARIEKGVEKALLDRLKKGVVSIFSYPMKANFDAKEFILI